MVRRSATARSTRTTRAADRATALCFALALLVPWFDHLLRADAARDVSRENRLPAVYPKPVSDLASLSLFPLAFERWFCDRLGTRDLLLRASQLETAVFLGLDPSITTIRGEQGFDFFGGDDSERVHRGVRPSTTKELETWRRSLEIERERCRRLGAEFVFVIVPDKQTIYPERWPRERTILGATRLDQFAQWMKENSDVRFVDLRAALTLERANDREAVGDFVYHPLGSHLTWRGAFAAWDAVAAACADIEPAPRRLNRAEFAVRELPENENDSMWDLTYVGDLFHQRGYALDHVRGPSPRVEYGAKNEILSSTLDDTGLPSALFVHDSFGPWMLPYVVHSFSRVNAVWTHRVPRELIERHRPRIVVQEITERSLTWPLSAVESDLEHVTEQEFQTFAPLLGPLDLHSEPLFATRGSVSISRSTDGWAIDQRAGDGLIVLPSANLTEGADLALKIEIVAPSEGNALLFYQTRTEPRFARVRCLAVNLEKGPNRLLVRTRANGLCGGLQVRLSTNGGYTLRAFEMRSAR